MANMNSRVAIQETYDLPSAGKFNGVPAKITLRAMSLLDEKQRLAAQGINGIIDLIGNCTVKPDGFNPYMMPRFDVDVAMVKLRIISHGPQYNVEVYCPHCGKLNKTQINLDEIPIKYVPEDFEPIFEIGPMPVSGDILKVKVNTFEDIDNIDGERRRILTKFPEYVGDPADVLNYIYKIVEVNGENRPFPQMKLYVENMTASDSIYFDQVYNDFLDQYGLDTEIAFVCGGCKEGFVRTMPMNAEFFRPKYDTPKRKDL